MSWHRCELAGVSLAARVVVDLPVALAHKVLAGKQRPMIEDADAPVEFRVEEFLCQHQIRLLEEVRQFLSTDRTVIYRFNPDWSGFIAVESVAVGTMPILGIDINDTCFQEYYVSIYEQGHIRAIDNIYTAGISVCIGLILWLLSEVITKHTSKTQRLQLDRLWRYREQWFLRLGALWLYFHHSPILRWTDKVFQQNQTVHMAASPTFLCLTCLIGMTRSINYFCSIFKCFYHFAGSGFKHAAN